MKFPHLSTPRSEEMEQQQTDENQENTDTIEDVNYFDSYEDLEVRLTGSTSYFYYYSYKL